MANKLQIKTPLTIAITLAVGMFLGTKLQKNLTINPKSTSSNLDEIASLINKYYVDTLQTDSIIKKLQYQKDKTIDSVDKATIENLLKQLDPHSVYLPPVFLKQSNEEMKGEFAGIGIEYAQYKDTILVNYIVLNGPAQKAQLQIGDKIIKVDDSIVSGVNITTARLRKLLRGDINSTVAVQYLRYNKLNKTTITRGTIALPSIDASYMINEKTGYIKLGKFSLTSAKEVKESIAELQKTGMQNLVFDLRGNGGGSLQDAVNIVDEFVAGKELVTFTIGAKQSKQEYFTQNNGVMEKGKLAILIDESSASASEVVAGALQDLDRATIIGRRSFGKGLVQRQFGLANNAAIRLTVARYYTPSGRCIQKSYTNGKDKYEEDMMHRINDKSLFVADSNKLDKSVTFKTKNGKLVYGGGGIMPDFFIPLDTSISYFTIYGKLQETGVLVNYVNEYLQQHKEYFTTTKTVNQFLQSFSFTTNDWQYLQKMCIYEKVEISKITATQKNIITNRVKQLIARQIWRNNGFYQVANENDNTIKKAIELLK